MTRDIFLRISGWQKEASDPEGSGQETTPIEVETPAVYYHKNGKHYLRYEEKPESGNGSIHNQIKFSEGNTLEILRSGEINTTMAFEEQKKTHASYQTPYGQMRLGIWTTSFQVEEEGDDRLTVHLAYQLDIDEVPYTDCQVEIEAVSKK